jgi:hypothetical protein
MLIIIVIIIIIIIIIIFLLLLLLLLLLNIRPGGLLWFHIFLPLFFLFETWKHKICPSIWLLARRNET